MYVWLQIYVLPDSTLSPIPFGAFRVDDSSVLIQRACVAQASSLRTLSYARKRWCTISSSSSSEEPQSPPEVGLRGVCVCVCVCVIRVQRASMRAL